MTLPNASAIPAGHGREQPPARQVRLVCVERLGRFLSFARRRPPARAVAMGFRTDPAAGSGGAPGGGGDAGLDAPGDADARALTFAQQVAPVKKVGPLVPIGGDFCRGGGDGWMRERSGELTSTP